MRRPLSSILCVCRRVPVVYDPWGEGRVAASLCARKISQGNHAGKTLFCFPWEKEKGKSSFPEKQTIGGLRKLCVQKLRINFGLRKFLNFVVIMIFCNKKFSSQKFWVFYYEFCGHPGLILLLIFIAFYLVFFYILLKRIRLYAL